MQYRRIAGTEIDVSEVGFGVWTVTSGWWGTFSDDEAASLLQEALDLGITFFDTAETYGDGRGESVLAHAFPGAARDQIVIGTKFGYDWRHRPEADKAGHQEARHCWEPSFLEEALRGSLQRLGTDRIDHWQLHNRASTRCSVTTCGRSWRRCSARGMCDRLGWRWGRRSAGRRRASTRCGSGRRIRCR